MIKENYGYSLLNHNTFGIDVKADRFVEYTTVGDLKQLITIPGFREETRLHIGGGSNLLFMDDFHGVVLHSLIGGMEIVNETEESVWVRVGAGEVWDDFVAWCVDRGLGGVENLSLIPGEVGASAVQNIGAYGVEAKDVIEKVETVEVATGCERSFSTAECGFAYRHSIFKRELKSEYVVTYVTFRLSKRPVYRLDYGNIKAELEKYPQTDLSAIRQAIIAIRRDKLPDPKTEGNAGSFFMNPVISSEKFEKLKNEYPDIPHYDAGPGQVKVPAAWLIDRCGWKGRSVGRAGVHPRQALVLVNRGGATGKEIADLSEQIRFSVREKYRIEICPEVNFIG